MELVIGSNNKGKIIELTECLSGLDITIEPPPDLPAPDETGATYAENAELKARYFFEATGKPTLADDSGIVIDALAGELGVHTRRWGAGADASDKEWITYFLERMKDESDRSARFVCTIAYIDSIGHCHLFEGVNEGVITETVEADYLPGLPIAGCFKPQGFDLVYSAMSIDQKNTVSHRGQAMQQFTDYISS